MNAVRRMGETIKKTAALTRDQDALGCAKLVVFCNPVQDNPFMAGAFHGVTEPETVINVGVSGPGVVKHALEGCRGADIGVVAETIKKTAFKITRVGQLVAQEAAKRLGTQFGSLTYPLPQRRLLVTVWPTSLRRLVWNAAELPARQQPLPC